MPDPSAQSFPCVNKLLIFQKIRAEPHVSLTKKKCEKGQSIDDQQSHGHGVIHPASKNFWRWENHFTPYRFLKFSMAFCEVALAGVRAELS